MSSSAARALTILDELARSASPLGVTEIARALSLPPGTVFRSLDALSRAGLIARYRASARYVPGPAAERLQRNIIAGFPAREVCLPYLRQLASISGETVSLHVRMGWYVVRICSVPGTGEVMTLPPPGEAQALAESCAGQAILAFLPKSEIAACRAWSGKQGSNSILPLSHEHYLHLAGRSKNAKHFSGGGEHRIDTPPREFKDEFARLPAKGRRIREPWRRVGLDRIAARGFATADGAIAFPVRAQREAVAAITIDHPFPAGENDDHLSACRDVIANIEGLASAQPSLFANPFSHLDPNALRF